MRSALYYRLRWLWPWLARPGVRPGLRLLGWTLFATWLVFVLMLSALRYVVLPQVGDYQAAIEQAATKAVGQPVKIGKISARWRGLNPDLLLDDVDVLDTRGQPAFSLQQVEAVLSWQTLVRWRPTLALLALDAPVLHVRRSPGGRISIAGLEAEGESNPAFAEWVLEQPRIKVRDATIVWSDELRQAPPLILEDLQLSLENRGRRHRFGLSAEPPAALASRIEMRGELKGAVSDAVEQLVGQVFFEMDYTDLAAWQPWIDYPMPLPRGRGALRVWGNLAAGGVKLTADVALEDLRVRLAKDLPELALSSLRGRLEAGSKGGQREVVAHKLELQMLDGLRVAPSDFRVAWRHANDGLQAGEASASFLDLVVLDRLASHLPLDERSRQLLAQYRPQGRISDLKASWTLAAGKLEKYALKARFSDLGVSAAGYFPGASGLTGGIDVNEKAGELVLDAAQSSLSLPAVFPQPDIAFDQLKARVNWKVQAAALTVDLERLQFASADAAGTAHGRYLYDGTGPGVIDLAAEFSRAEASAVWRFLPHVVSATARDWVRRGVVAGKGYDGKLVLKGNLADFPFRDPARGTFVVTAKASGGKVDYVPGWPTINNIEADLLFGVGMKIVASKGEVLGTRLSEVTVDIPDFESREEPLLIRGKAQGASSEFLRFIEQSPVSAMIDRFTEGIKVSGNGTLDLALDLPLRHLADTRLRASYQIQDNQIEIVSALPPISGVNGQLLISEKSISASDLGGQLFGGPLKAQIKSSGGRIVIEGGGTATAASLARHFRWPLMDRLTGSAAWKAVISIRGHNADFVIESPLTGIGAPLPAPLNKPVGSSWPLRIERSALDARREQYKVTLGPKTAQALLVRRDDGKEMRNERAVVVVGEGELRLPEHGVAVMLAAPQLDADAWRSLFAGDGEQASSSSDIPLSLLAIKTPRLHLLGRDLNHADVKLHPLDGGWQIALNMDELDGELVWRSAGEGSLNGRLRRLILRPGSDPAASVNTLVNSLPSMNLTVDAFYLDEKPLGQLELKARNDKGAWQLDTLNIKNADAQLRSRGVWRNTGQQQMHLDFDLAANDLGKLLDRLGYGDSIKRGSGNLSGSLGWNGSPTAIDYPSLSGKLAVVAEKGQFNKIEPGAGKLLGLLSLQSLSRRLTLDFRDVLSDGLAFDRIEGKLALKKGIMQTTTPLTIRGPAAQVEMEGDVDLKNETQNMRVVVRPELGTVAAVGVALINPLAGAATLLASGVMQNPLNRLFSYRYHVTGTWADPLVDQTAGNVKMPEIDLQSETGGKE